ncbi:hypothetical protein HQ496_01845 [bacterium]|nr:hypothetical protein [bacterium]
MKQSVSQTWFELAPRWVGLGLLSAILLLLSVRDVSAQIIVRGKLAHDIDVFAGQQVTGTITVDNESDTLQEAKVYLTDYMFHADGTNDYDEAGTGARSNANWIRFSPETMTVPPKSTVVVNYEITIPADAKAGSYWSMMMVEGVDASSAESSTAPETERQVGFRQVTRYGVQVAVHIQQDAEKNVSFDEIQLLVDEDGNTFFQVDVTNTGALMLRPTVYMRIFAADGTEYGPFDGTQYRMYPDTSVRQRIELSSLPAGTYQALLVVDNGEDAVFGGQYELTL